MTDVGKFFQVIQGELYENYHIFLSNYELSGFWNNQVNLYEFFLLVPKFKQKFELSWNFELHSFELTRFYCIPLKLKVY
jgi:hypothetical protein